MNAIIFCKVIDNFGDIGVCLRLARGLLDRACHVTLVTDRPDLAARMDPVAEVRVLGWNTVEANPASLHFTESMLVVEAFQVTPPPAFLQACPLTVRRICLDYLATEAWADGLQGMPAPDPAFTKHARIWMAPSFSSQGPGVIRGRWQEIDETTRSAMRRRLMTDTLDAMDIDRTFLVLAFGYDDAPWGALSEAIERQGLPEGFDRVCFVKPAGLSYSQVEFDAVLQSCDLNFVRGEDSFVRAHFAAAGRWKVPFVWQPYRQEGEAHQQKLQAWQQWMVRCDEGLAPPTPLAQSAPLQAYWNAWLGMASFFNPVKPSACITEDDFSVCWGLLIIHWAAFVPGVSRACQRLVGTRALEDSLLSPLVEPPVLRSGAA